MKVKNQFIEVTKQVWKKAQPEQQFQILDDITQMVQSAYSQLFSLGYFDEQFFIGQLMAWFVKEMGEKDIEAWTNKVDVRHIELGIHPNGI
jgi:hypothetical protein